MKIQKLIAGLFTLVFYCLFVTTRTHAVEAGAAMPKLKIKAFKGDTLNTEKLGKKVTIINFWATWCGACLTELKEMAEIFKPIANDSNVQLAFVSVDKDPTKAAAWLKSNAKKLGADFSKYLYQDPDFNAAEALSIDNFPVTLVVDAQGQVKHLQKGFKTGSNSTQEIFNAAKGLL